MTAAGFRLLLAVVLALIAGFIFGVRWAVSMDTSDHRRYLPPVPADLAFTPFPSPPAPTLPASCCRPDDEPEQPTISAPDPAVTIPVPRATADQGIPVSSEPVVRAGSGFQLRGKASRHATGRDGYFAAACRPLRKAIGPGWRGSRVLVAFKRRAIEVKLNDWCASRDKTIDLSDEAWDWFGVPRSRGVIRVAIGGFR